MSVLESLGIPPQFGVVLLAVAFALAVAPYLSGADFGVLRIPLLEEGTRKRLRLIGPIVMVGAIALHVPVLPNSKGPNPSPPCSHSSHPAVGGEWYEFAFNAYIKFAADGTLSGSYYQHEINGKWTLSNVGDCSILFHASFVEPAPGITMQWTFPVLATVTGNTMTLTWDGRSDTAVRR
jgi:hypothetical protein